MTLAASSRRSARGSLLGPLLLLSLALHLGAVAWWRLPVSPAGEYPVRLNVGLVVETEPGAARPEPEAKAAPDRPGESRAGRPPAAKRASARVAKPHRLPREKPSRPAEDMPGAPPALEAQPVPQPSTGEELQQRALESVRKRARREIEEEAARHPRWLPDDGALPRSHDPRELKTWKAPRDGVTDIELHGQCYEVDDPGIADETVLRLWRWKSCKKKPLQREDGEAWKYFK